jgi:hypothetical protein
MKRTKFKYDETYAMVYDGNVQILVYYTIEKNSRYTLYDSAGYSYYYNGSGGKYEIELQSVELTIADEDTEILPILSKTQQDYIIEKILNNGI